MTAAPVSFSSGPLRLEGRLATPERAHGAAVICHPHPLYGGSMDNNVVGALERSLRAAGYVTLAFNFRGVGGSDGGYGDFDGECDDARAALAFLRGRGDVPATLIAGYSFGAMVAVHVGGADKQIERVIAVAPPLTMLPAPVDGGGGAAKRIIIGDRDQYCPVDGLRARRAAVAQDRPCGSSPAADHFFVGFETDIEAAVAEP